MLNVYDIEWIGMRDLLQIKDYLSREQSKFPNSKF